MKKVVFDHSVETSFSHLCPSKTDKTYLCHILVICIESANAKSCKIKNVPSVTSGVIIVMRWSSSVTVVFVYTHIILWWKSEIVINIQYTV